MHTPPDDWGCFAPPNPNTTHISLSLCKMFVLFLQWSLMFTKLAMLIIIIIFSLNVCDLIYLLAYPQGLGYAVGRLD